MTNSKSIFMSVAAFVIACAASAVWAEREPIVVGDETYYPWTTPMGSEYYTNAVGEAYDAYETEKTYSISSDPLKPDEDGIVEIVFPKFDERTAAKKLRVPFVEGSIVPYGIYANLDVYYSGGDFIILNETDDEYNLAARAVSLTISSSIYSEDFFGEEVDYADELALVKNWPSKKTTVGPGEQLEVWVGPEESETAGFLEIIDVNSDDGFPGSLGDYVDQDVSGQLAFQISTDPVLKNNPGFSYHVGSPKFEVICTIEYSFKYQAVRYLSSAVDIRLYESGEGVIAEFQTTDENAEEPELDEEGGEGSASGAMIDIYAKLDGGDVEMDDGMYKKIGSVKAVGSGSNLYKINVTDLVPGESYTIRIHDEEGNWHTIRGAKVGRFAMDMSRMSPEGMELKWTSIPGREYGIMYAEALVGPWKEIARVTADGSSETYFVWYKDLGPSTSRFFKAVMIDDSVSAE